MNDDLLSSTLEPAITPAFLEQLDQLPRVPEADQPVDTSWVAFLLKAMAGRAPQPQAMDSGLL